MLLLGCAGCVSLSACVSGPIDLAGEDPVDVNAIDTQSDLRRLASALASRVEAARWSLTGQPGETTRNFLGRLIGGGDAVVEPAELALQSYLGQSDAATVIADVSVLADDTQAVSQHVLRVASSDSILDLDGLDRDIEMTERALGAVRRAEDFFARVGDEVSFDPEQESMFAAQLAELNTAQTFLTVSADALAERRWAIAYGAIG